MQVTKTESERESKRCKCKLDNSELGYRKRSIPRADEGSGIEALTRGVEENQVVVRNEEARSSVNDSRLYTRSYVIVICTPRPPSD